MKRTLNLFGSMLFAAALIAAPGGSDGRHCDPKANMRISCSRASGMVQIQIDNCRRIGDVVMEIKDQRGRVLYREEGNARTGELVRRLDKGVFPKGTHTVSVQARDFAISQVFTIE
ncbi:MAG: hypothetical protein IPI81_06155 [Flavobacteriales bacterium]|nr:hypothetical protein [Flavobacteriales bacterium]